MHSIINAKAGVRIKVIYHDLSLELVSFNSLFCMFGCFMKLGIRGCFMFKSKLTPSKVNA